MYTFRMTSPWCLLVTGFSYQQRGKMSGVLGGVQDVVVGKQLRRGILDSELFFTRDEYDPAAPAGVQDRKLCPLPETYRTEEFEKKRSLVQLRIPAFMEWRQVVLASLYRKKDFYTDMDLYFLHELAQSERGHLSQNLSDFARASGMPETEAYEYVKLYTEEHVSKQLMVFALAEKYAAQLNSCDTKEALDAVIREMSQLVLGRKSS